MTHEIPLIFLPNRGREGFRSMSQVFTWITNPDIANKGCVTPGIMQHCSASLWHCTIAPLRYSNRIHYCHSATVQCTSAQLHFSNSSLLP